jgi:hypothetical protein
VELIMLEPEQIDENAERLAPFLANVASRSHGRYSVANILDLARRGVWQLWLILDGAAIAFVGGTELVLYPAGLKVLAVRFGTGRGRVVWQHHIETVLDWARAQGCTYSEGTFRKGWRKVLPGWTHTHDSLERAL